MDEPFGALDPQTRWGMQSLLLDVSRTEDNTILFVTHDVSEAVYLADSIYVLAPRPTKILHRSEDHTSELQSPCNLVCRLLLEKKNAPAPGRASTPTQTRRLAQ